MPRKGENIYKRKDGRWEGRYVKGHTDSGKIIYGYVYAYSYKEAKNKLTNSVGGKEENVKTKPQKIRFKELSELWLESRKNTVKKSTHNKYSNILYSYVIPYIGNKQLNEISPECVVSLCESLIETGGVKGKGLSKKTVADTLSVIKNIIKYSRDKGYDLRIDLNSITIKQKPPQLNVLSESDIKALYFYLNGTVSAYNIGILICLLTGVRIGEVCALCWEDISFRDHTIHISKTAQRIQDTGELGKKTKVILTSPKSVTGKRTIPIPENLERILKDFKSKDEGFVVSKDCVHLTEPRVLQYHFKRILDILNIKQVNFHVLRHTFATRCIEVGFDVKSLSEILGHSTVSITMNKYVHPSMELKRENMKRFSSLFAVK